MVLRLLGLNHDKDEYIERSVVHCLMELSNKTYTKSQCLVDQMHQSFPQRSDDIIQSTSSPWHVSLEEASIAADRQDPFFKALDSFNFHLTNITRMST